MFRTRLDVSNLDGPRWRLSSPLVYEGTSQYFIDRRKVGGLSGKTIGCVTR